MNTKVISVLSINQKFIPHSTLSYLLLDLQDIHIGVVRAENRKELRSDNLCFFMRAMLALDLFEIRK